MSQIPDSSLEADLRQLLVQAQILVGDGQKTVGMSNFVTVRVKSSVINGVTGSKDTVPLESQLAKRLQDLSVTENTLPTLPHDPTPSELQWRFVLESLSIVTSIHNTIVAMERTGSLSFTRDPLGVRDLRLVHTLLEIIISWGVYPNLLPGVGVPLSKRTRSRYVQRGVFAEADPSGQVNAKSSQRKLYRLMKGLYNIALSKEEDSEGEGKKSDTKIVTFTSVSSVIVTRHLTDLFAGLLQLAYAPLAGTANSDPEHNANEAGRHTGSVASVDSLIIASPGTIGGLAAISVDETDATIVETSKDNDRPLAVSEREEIEWLFQDTFSRSDPYRVLESLTLLLGTSPLHPTPRWLRNVCGRYLSRVLLRPNGVQIVLEYMCGGSGGDLGEVSLAQLERITKLVLSVPYQVQSLEEYYSIICPQLISIIQRSVQKDSPNTNTLPPAVVQAAAFILTRLIHRHQSLAQTLVILPIIGPLLLYDSPPPISPSSTSQSSFDLDPLLVSEEDLQLLFRTIHVFLVGNEPSPALLQSFLRDAIVPLYQAYAFACQSRSGDRETVQDVINTYLRIVETRKGVEALKRVVFGVAERETGRVGETYFAMGDGGGLVLRQRLTANVAPPTELGLDVNIFVEFLQGVGNKDLAGDLFVIVRNEYSSIKASATTVSSGTRRTNPRFILTLLNLVRAMLDSLGPTILGNPMQIIAFANNVVEEYVLQQEEKKLTEVSRAPEIATVSGLAGLASTTTVGEEGEGDDETQTLVLALSLVTVVLQEHQSLPPQSYHILALISSNLVPITTNHPSASVRDMARQLRLAITSRAAAESTPAYQDSSTSALKYQEALTALQDDLLPVRAHGMAILKEMVLARDPLVGTGEGLDRVLDIFVQMVQDEDSFVYLNAVKGLSALTDVHGNLIIAKLAAIYRDEKQTLDHRLRVGEALMQTVQRAGEALGKYVDTLLNPCFAVLGSSITDGHLRVSALSVLGIACETSPQALTPRFHEMVDLALSILGLDKTVEVRRSATVLILSLIRGLASQTLYEYPAELLSRTYRTLRSTEETDTDELTRYQARVALSDLDVVIRGELFKGQQRGLGM